MPNLGVGIAEVARKRDKRPRILQPEAVIFQLLTLVAQFPTNPRLGLQ